MKYVALIPVLMLFFGLSACQDSGTGQAIEDDSKVLATVGTYQVTQAYLNAYLQAKGVKQADQQQAAQALDEVIKMLSLGHQAEQSGMQLSLDQSLRIEQTRHRAMAQVAMEQYLLDKPVTEEDIKAEYQRVTAALQGQEYHVHHMLFNDEVPALSALDQLASGENYLAIEQQYLGGLESPKNVGDIGWVNIMQVPEVFRGPLQSLQAGQFHPTALQSQFGVHVLYLADKRPLTPPDYEAVKAGIKQSLEKEKLDRYQQLAVIKSKAKIVK